ncbi:hypothetical protein COCVIDRAFT_31457 [Bipolaris victoriae FI3]|uniref:F-box domain-containing protein n=1 Tax=Bipolaris victoriae (strain FI3) TaxID=930091 RepID=W7E5R1_BIPV3|nr:hypothetical protein COCVIDRAFT_31457 [Bipolaris victoriae FI3]
MNNTLQTTPHRTPILDLPDEILLDIFGCSDSGFPVHNPSEYRKPCITEASDRLEFLGTNRLVCRAFNRLISPLLCPVLSVSLGSRSIDRLEGLSRNPLIAQGIRGIAISLIFRPSAIASDFQRYYDYADSVLRTFEGECDWHTEFGEYDQDDMSNDAIVWRNYDNAWTSIGNMRYIWKCLLEKRSSGEDILEPDGLTGRENKGPHESIAEDENLEEAQAILTGSFSKYVAAHADQVRIISDKSFVRSVARALSRCGTVPFVWFNEDRIGEEGPRCDALTIATDKEALSHVLTQGHEWLRIENTLCKDDDDTELFFPASILTELPIVCHNAAIRLRGISVDCFPLLKSYCCLVPQAVGTDDSVLSDPWARFAAACHYLEIFNFGKRGMHCTPLRPEHQSASDLAIINNFIGAAISGRHLQEFELSMTSLRVRRQRPGEIKEEDLYVASPILAAIKSTQLRNIMLSDVDISGQALLGLVQSASPRHLKKLYLSGVNLSSGRYAMAMSQLHEIVLLRRDNNGSKPNIQFNTLQGAEFGEPSAFDDGDNLWMYGPEKEHKAFWDRVEKHRHPEKLKQLEQWVSDTCNTVINPLLESECGQN